MFLRLNKINKEVAEMTNKTFNIMDLLDYKNYLNLGIGNTNEKEFVKYMKKYEYCSNDTTKANIEFIKDRGYINIKCNGGFSNKFISFLNKYNCINDKSDRVKKFGWIVVYKDIDGMKDIKYIKDTDNYKELTIQFRSKLVR